MKPVAHLRGGGATAASDVTAMATERSGGSANQASDTVIGEDCGQLMILTLQEFIKTGVEGKSNGAESDGIAVSIPFF